MKVCELAKKEETPKEEVTIIDRSEITTYPKIKQAVVNVAVTYVVGGYPPRTVFIPKTAWSKQAEKDAIKADIERVRATPPETFTI